MAISLLEMKNLQPDPFRQGVVSLLWENSGVMPLLNFIEQAGFAYPYSVVSKLPGIGFRNLNAVFSETQSVINPAVEHLAIVGGKIKTDSVSLKVKGPKARQGEIERQLKAAAKFWDKSFFNGDPAVTLGSFIGLRARIGGNQLLTPAAGAATPPTMDDFTRLQDQVEGPNSTKVIFMNQATRRNLSHDVQKNAKGQRILEDGGMQGVGAQVGIPGSPWQKFNGSRIQEIFYDEAELPILPFTETSSTASAYCCRLGDSTDESYLQGISGMPGNFDTIGPINFGEYIADVVQGLFGIGVFSGYGVARLQGLTNANTG